VPRSTDAARNDDDASLPFTRWVFQGWA